MHDPLPHRRVSWPIIAFFALTGTLLALSLIDGMGAAAAGFGMVAALVTWLIVANRRSIADAERRRGKPGPFGPLSPRGDEPPATFSHRLAQFALRRGQSKRTASPVRIEDALLEQR